MTEPIGERVAVVEAKVETIEQEIMRPETGVRARLHSIANKLTVVEGRVEKLNWKIGMFVGAVVIVGNKLVDFGFGRLFK